MTAAAQLHAALDRIARRADRLAEEERGAERDLLAIELMADVALVRAMATRAIDARFGASELAGKKGASAH